jgi:ERCC4-type nuclease
MVRVVVDERERSQVPEHLKDLGLSLDFRLLEEGDYIVSGYAVERKTVRDFLLSLYSGRLFDQAYRLGQAYRLPILVVEGDFYSALRDMKNPRVFWGALVTVSFRYGLRVFFTRDPEETAELINILARHSPELKVKQPIVVRKPRSGKLREGQVALVQALPGVGNRLAEQLLRRFGSPRKIFQAPESELIMRGGLPRTAAAKITSLLNADYNRLGREPTQLRLSDVRPQP